MKGRALALHTPGTRSALAAALLLAVLAGGPALAGCPPPEPMLAAIRAATRVQFEQLGGDETRIETPLAHVPGRTLGHEVHGVFRVSPAVSSALRDAFSRLDSYACPGGARRGEFPAPEGLPIGIYFVGSRGSVAAVFRLPEGEVELQVEGGEILRLPLSRAGQGRWEQALRALAKETRASPAEFYEQMLPPDRVPPMRDAPADTTGAPGSGGHSPREESSLITAGHAARAKARGER